MVSSGSLKVSKFQKPIFLFSFEPKNLGEKLKNKICSVLSNYKFFTYLPKNWTSFINVPADVRPPDGDSIIIDRLTKLRNEGKNVRPVKNASLEDQKSAEISYNDDKKNQNFKVGSFVAIEYPNNRLGVAEKGSSIKRELLFVAIRY